MKSKSHHIQNVKFYNPKYQKQPSAHTKKGDQPLQTTINHIYANQRSHKHDSMSSQNQFSYSQLDLIFKKQPKQIQQKLMKLLIHYNALMQYNVQTNMFQVDLLLPFINESQKANFVKQFLAIRRGNHENTAQLQKQNQIQVLKSQNEKGSTQIRKFSFNNSNSFEFVEKEDFNTIAQHNNHSNHGNTSREGKQNVLYWNDYHQQQFGLDQQQSNLSHQKQVVDDSRDWINNHRRQDIQLQEQQKANNMILPDIVSTIGHNNKIDYSRLKETIINKIKRGLALINQKIANRNQEIRQNSVKPIFIYQQESQQAKLQQKQITKEQQSIIHQLSTNSYNQTLKSNDSKHLTASQYIREDIDDDQLFQETKHPQTIQNISDHLNSHYHRFQQIILQQQEEQDIQPLFDHHDHQKANKNTTSFEQYTRKYTTVKQNQNKKKENPHVKMRNERNNVRIGKDNDIDNEKRYWSSKQKKYYGNESMNEPTRARRSQKGEKINTQNVDNIQKSNKKLQNRSYAQSKPNISQAKIKTPSKYTTKALNQNVAQFFDAYKQNIDKIYVEIQARINQRQALPLGKGLKAKEKINLQQENKGIQDLFILVMDQQEQGSAESINVGQFKNQIIEDYSRQIMVNNKSLSSEDLIKYFKYLHFHAKRLYLKYINHRQK